ncbi:hypothetical protein J1N35_016303 [Gossypium stocksii]|uniref:RNase H type-1 domain-containing protein n=1 Tax=Gossypium stocksii TaxID=47602 RepID=A0A9D3VJY9_9ROSI|nr:hypothetical protein J1N35_016303 [Gossypium stocksii]
MDFFGKAGRVDGERVWVGKSGERAREEAEVLRGRESGRLFGVLKLMEMDLTMVKVAVKDETTQGQLRNLKEIVNNSLCWASQWHSPTSANSSGGFVLPLEEQVYESTIFLNTNGAVRMDNGHAFAGGAARDRNGQWLFDFNRYLRSCLIFVVELWGTLEGLKLAQRRGHDCVIIFWDSSDVVWAIQGSFSSKSNSASIR